jgi:CRP-like cAMP-binding protein
MHSHHHGINIQALLAHVPLFNELESEEIVRLARGSRELAASRGDILFHKGDLPTGFYLIVYGQVKLAFTSAQGGEKVVDILGQGQTFGEAVMFMDKPCMVYAQALADSLLLHIAKTAILDELDTRSQARPQDDRRPLDASASPDQRRGIVLAAFGSPAHHRLPAARQS